MRSITFLQLLLAIALPVASAFGVFQKAGLTKKSPLTDQAVSIYQTKFPEKNRPRKRAFNAAVGMPVKDLDGTKFNIAKDNKMGKTFGSRTEQELVTAFTELAKVYGDEVALQMVKDVPLVLAASPKNYQPVLTEFSETFGPEQATNTIIRNPSLLFLNAKSAAAADDLTVQFSYVVAATRPLGPFLLYGLISLLFEPTVEIATGIPIRENLFGSFL